MSEELLVSAENGILTVIINRPDARNAMTRGLAEAMSAAWDRLEADPALRCAILAGAGGTFCSGMDLKGFLKGELPVAGTRGFGALTAWTPRKPVIAAVEGHALAGGFELALSCDMIVARGDARFGFPEAKRGLVAGGGGMVHLPRWIGRAAAMELMLTGEPINAARAYALGLINHVVDGPAVAAARALAENIIRCGPLAVEASKAVIRDSWLWDDADIRERQNAYIGPVFASEDAREGVHAFAGKRHPDWRGR